MGEERPQDKDHGNGKVHPGEQDAGKGTYHRTDKPQPADFQGAAQRGAHDHDDAHRDPDTVGQGKGLILTRE